MSLNGLFIIFTHFLESNLEPTFHFPRIFWIVGSVQIKKKKKTFHFYSFLITYSYRQYRFKKLTFDVRNILRYYTILGLLFCDISI